MTLRQTDTRLRLFRYAVTAVCMLSTAGTLIAQTTRKAVPVKTSAHTKAATAPANTAAPASGSAIQPAKFVEVMPAFDGDMSAYLSSHLRYPDSSKAKNQTGKSVVKFVVNPAGDIESAQIVRSSGFILLDEEALRVVRSMPRWRPGTQDGKPVAVYFTLPFTFTLDD